MIQSLTLSSGMENLQQVASLALAMVRLSFSTLVELVLSSGTEINHKSVMTPSTSHRDLQQKKKSPSYRNRLWHKIDCGPEQTETGYSKKNSVTRNINRLSIAFNDHAPITEHSMITFFHGYIYIKFNKTNYKIKRNTILESRDSYL